MPNKKTADKSWAVYWGFEYFIEIGKLAGYLGKDLLIQKREGGEREGGETEAWNFNYSRTFDEPLKALAYLLFNLTADTEERKFKSLKHQKIREDLLQDFLLKFPSERKTLETSLAQSQPK
ncbi:MAG TPA: hypothetical protein VMC80_03805 [Patescibacteria group bacterium]|nr:hypothetical protein [Patescibacteria group bacterium]